jgi:primosomal protein N' (replication factor Y)
VVDEAHETAYKQDQAPHYHATTVAARLASLHHSVLVLGSATPLVTDYYVASAKQRPIVRMTQTATGSNVTVPTSQVVDLRNRKNFSRSSYISDALITAMKDALQNGEQSLLFLNRRGTARVIFCEQCGWQAECPHCDLPLVYHGDTHRMRCHSCNFSAATATSCPECRNASVVFKVIGTKAIADEAARLFPEANVMRFDTDNKKSERMEVHYDDLKSGTVQILVGTQTLAKGLDLPKLGVVGVVIADTSLYFPDFSAKERTYELLVQVLGRVGRGHRDGRIVIQTYMPDSPLLQAAITKDWDTFYETELNERRLFTFPPYCYLLKLTCKRATSAAAAKTATQLAQTIRAKGYKILIEGPAPSFHEKINGKYAWQLIVKTKDRSNLIRIIRELPSGWSYDIDPSNLL